jgi:hypothetical protein
LQRARLLHVDEETGDDGQEDGHQVDVEKIRDALKRTNSIRSVADPRAARS